MRRVLVVLLVSVGMLGLTGRAGADDPDSHRVRNRDAVRATAALAEARDALAPKPAAARVSGDIGEATLALTRMRALMPSMTPSQRQQAEGIVARPTDPGDFSAYTVAEATPVCSPHVCVHYVTSTSDAPPLADADVDGVPDWVETTLTELEKVWTYEVSTRGYRAPATDGTRGGDLDKFDVYLANLGDQSLYGYCDTEDPVAVPDPSYSFRFNGYCVLDDDFAEFALPPRASMQVTAAHEFFHAIQFNYDAFEDRWLMEATATWMEERYADAVNDNRQYLPSGQLRRNTVSLDRFEQFGSAQYGNWIFFERLSRSYGVDSVRSIWSRLDSTNQATDQFSSQAVRNYLASKSTTFVKFYARFAAGNLIPAKVYEEGRAYPKAPITSSFTLTNGTRSTGPRSLKLNHQTNRNVAFAPGSTLTGTWRVKIVFDGPVRATGTAAYVLIHRKDGTVVHKPLTVNSEGNATYYAPFSRSTIARVTLTMANGSTRVTNCWTGTDYSCGGASLDNGRVYKYKATAVR